MIRPFRSWVWGPALWALSAAPVVGQDLGVSYTLRVANPESQLVEVEMTVDGYTGAAVDLSLPAWTPGFYHIEDYARFVRKFQAVGPEGQRLPVGKQDKDTWRVGLGGSSAFTVRFEYRADTLDLNQSYVTEKWAVLNGTTLFPFVEDRYDLPATVRLDLPEGWQVVTGLRPTEEDGVFTAPDYHYLVDAPLLMGRLSVDSLSVDGRWIRVAVAPEGVMTESAIKDLLQRIGKMAAAQHALMGGAPYEDFTFQYVLTPQGRGGLEHRNSTLIILPEQVAQAPQFAMGVTAHEFFHLWNVKRIRPSELWPYDYTKEQYTPSLWVSEGITSYYTDISLTRAGLVTPEEFWESLARTIGAVENDEDGHWVSLAQASIDTWIRPLDNFYYTKGELLGLFLDLAIRHHSQNQASLDQVMQRLYRDYYEAGRGFSESDLRWELEGACGCGVTAFFREYVTGVAPLDYPRFLGYAGLSLSDTLIVEPFLGVATTGDPEGDVRVVSVVPVSSAARAGLWEGDVILRIGDFTPSGPNWGPAFRSTFKDHLGEQVVIVIRRGDDLLELPSDIGQRERQEFTIRPFEEADPLALTIRSSLVGQ